MKLALILPKYGVSIHDPCFAPLGFLYISAMAKKLCHSVDFYNFNLRDHSENVLKHYDAFLLTGGEEFIEFNKGVAKHARAWGMKTVLGGSLATFKSEDMAPHFDSVVVGEGEGVLADALSGVGIFQGKSLPWSKIPWPDYQGFGVEEYNRLHGMRYIGVLTSRGCPFSCSFCAHVCRYRERSLADVFDEVDSYRDRYKIEMLVVNDNTLNVRKPRFMEFCDGMAKRGVQWSAAIRTDRFDEEMAVAAKKSGASYFVVGVESFLQDRLDRMGKRTTVGDNERCLNLLHKYGIQYHGNVLLGFDWDRPEDIARELANAPPKYNLFPALLQPFLGIKAKVGVFGAEREKMSKCFREYANSRGMSVYPDAAVAQ